MPRSSGLFPSSIPTERLYAHVLASIRATYPAHFTGIVLITRILFGEEYRS